MKTVIISELEVIQKAIAHSNMGDEDAENIERAFLEIAYQWCSSNASFCAFDALLKEEHSETWNALMHSFLRSRVYNETYMTKMKDTYPF